jgi:hypothetical protein
VRFLRKSLCQSPATFNLAPHAHTLSNNQEAGAQIAGKLLAPVARKEGVSYSIRAQIVYKAQA